MWRKKIYIERCWRFTFSSLYILHIFIDINLSPGVILKFLDRQESNVNGLLPLLSRVNDILVSDIKRKKKNWMNKNEWINKFFFLHIFIIIFPYYLFSIFFLLLSERQDVSQCMKYIQEEFVWNIRDEYILYICVSASCYRNTNSVSVVRVF